MKKLLLLVLVGFIFMSSCSINKMAMNSISDALTGSGSSDVFTGDSDPVLVGEALPFAIKLYETLLAQNPKHQGLILTTGSLFIMYANAYVQGPAEMLPQHRYLEKVTELERARKLYLRGADLLYSGLELKYPGFSESGQNGTLESYIAKLKKEDVPVIYWAVAGMLSAYSLDPFNMTLGVRIPELKFMIEKAYELDPDFNNGAIDDFFIIFYASMPEAMGGNSDLVDHYFAKAVEKSRGLSASPYVSYAKSVAIPAQDYDKFREMLETALTIDPDGDPSNRLVNILTLQKAKFLLDNAGLYFIDFGGDWDDWDDWDWEDWEWEFEF